MHEGIQGRESNINVGSKERDSKSIMKSTPENDDKNNDTTYNHYNIN